MWKIDSLGGFHCRRTISEFFNFVRQHGKQYTLSDVKGLIGEPLVSIWDEKRNGYYVAYSMYREPKLPIGQQIRVVMLMFFNNNGLLEGVSEADLDDGDDWFNLCNGKDIEQQKK